MKKNEKTTKTTKKLMKIAQKINIKKNIHSIKKYEKKHKKIGNDSKRVYPKGFPQKKSTGKIR